MTVVIAVIALVAALFLFAATRPNTYQVQRTATIKAPPDKVFAMVNDFHAWPGWSPWEKLDPMMKRTHTGPPSGPGAVYEWDGNKKAGAGRMEITSATPGSKVVIKLDFLKPFEGHNVTTFTLGTSGATTTVTWVMDGSANFMLKVMGLFISMDKMIGKDFEAGLANIKNLAER